MRLWSKQGRNQSLRTMPRERKAEMGNTKQEQWSYCRAKLTTLTHWELLPPWSRPFHFHHHPNLGSKCGNVVRTVTGVEPEEHLLQALG